jgi:hypothetical protein
MQNCSVFEEELAYLVELKQSRAECFGHYGKSFEDNFGKLCTVEDLKLG